jgi:hypothetical protein
MLFSEQRRLRLSPTVNDCHLSDWNLRDCHPERSMAIREANRQTKSKDPYHPGTPRADNRRSLDAASSVGHTSCNYQRRTCREVAACDSPARQCRVQKEDGASPVGTEPACATPALRIKQ